MNDHHVESYERDDKKRGWRITVGDDIVATDGGQGYENEKDCLAGLFGNFFGQWDDSFLELYQKWQNYAGQEYDVPSEAQAGVPVALRSEMSSPANDVADGGRGPVNVDRDEDALAEANEADPLRTTPEGLSDTGHPEGFGLTSDPD